MLHLTPLGQSSSTSQRIESEEGYGTITNPRLPGGGQRIVKAGVDLIA